jgi:hypothetical protein
MRTLLRTNPILNFFYNLVEMHWLPLKDMWNDAETKQEKAVAVFFGSWVAILMVMFWVGFSLLIYGVISGEADIQNATWGIFDTLG